MAISRNTSHVRSYSWPSESSHLLDLSIEHVLLKLRNSEVGGPSSFSASSICHKLGEIKKLYQAINNSIECPLNQQGLSFEQHRGGVEDALDGSLTLLDAFESTMDILSLVKESTLELESSLRRRSSVEENHIGAYMLSRKKIQKMVNKCLKNLHNLNIVIEKDDDHLVPVVRMLREAQCISFSIIKSAVVYFSLAQGKSCSLVTKLMHIKRESSEKQGETSELEKVDQALLAFEAKKLIINAESVHNLQKQLEALEMAVQEIEEYLESVSRCLLKTRVSLLNVLSH